MTERHKRAEDFLELVERSKRGRLKVHLGFAAGVGKTWRMLEEAHALKKRGVDVVLGFIETHGRAETAALMEGLAYIPRKRIEYRGLTIEEMDLDAIIARAPQVALVDEIAHEQRCRIIRCHRDSQADRVRHHRDDLSRPGREIPEHRPVLGIEHLSPGDIGGCFTKT